MKLFYLLPLALLTIAFNLRAQEVKVAPVSPEAASITKFINFPVDYSTGVPDITIPLYEIKSGEIDLPITLSYHAGGIKVNEKSSWVGLGWALCAEPEISRTINSIPDEISGYLTASYPYYSPLSGDGGQGLMQSITNGGLVDRDPDEFTYHLAHSSGKFYLTNNVAADTFHALPVPYAPIKIRIFKGAYPNITDVDGTYYRFGSSTHVDAEEVSQDIHGGITTWKCSQMISPSKKDTVNFTYFAQQPIQGDVNFNERVEVYDNFGFGNMSALGYGFFAFTPTSQASSTPYDPRTAYVFGTPRIANCSTGPDNGYYFVSNTDKINGMPVITKNSTPADNATSETFYSTIKIDSITYRQGRVKFYQHYHTQGITNELDSIQVLDYAGRKIKSVQFFLAPCSTSPYVGTADWMTHLDSLWIKDASGKLIERYAFKYNPGDGMQYGQKNADPWGYYNGDYGSYRSEPISVPYQLERTTNTYPAVSGDTLYPVFDTLSVAVGTPGNGVNTHCQAWMLSKIYYPTGGRAEFTYESNQSSSGVVGGLRIQSIKYFTDNSLNVSMEKHYTYGEHENGLGFVKTPNFPSNYFYDQTLYYVQPQIYGVTYDGSSGGTLMSQFSYITERKRTYSTHSLQQMAFSNGAPAVYGVVTEYQIDNGVQTGKTVYRYDYTSQNATVYLPLEGNISQQVDEWPRGHLLSTTHYAYTNGQYVWIRKDSSEYTSFYNPDIHIINVLKAFNEHAYLFGSDYTYGVTQSDYDNEFLMLQYQLTSGVKIPKTQSIFTRDVNDTTHVVAEKTNYYYDNTKSMYATRIVKTDGLGGILTDYITHPVDYSPTDPAMSPLVNANMMDAEVENVTTLLKSGASSPIILSASLNTYATDGTGYKLTEQQIEPSAPLALSSFKFSEVSKGVLPTSANIGVSNFVPDSSYVVKSAYNGYDARGNLLQMTSNGFQLNAYIWDYNSLYPVASVKNADTSKIAYTSFESSGSGGWAISPSHITPADARTGAKCYSLSLTGVINKSGLNATKTYIVSYWSTSATPYSVTGTVGTVTYAKKVPNAAGTGYWYLYNHTITGVSSTTIAGTGFIDEVRLYPSEAEMATFTYDPSKGMTSSTDAKGDTNYYSYDAYGRLILIQDLQGNVVKQFKYHYNYE